MQKPSEETFRGALEWITAECLAMRLPVGEVKVGLGEDGEPEVEYADTERGSLYMCHPESFTETPKTIAANMRRVRQRAQQQGPVPVVRRPPAVGATSPSFSRKVILRDGACKVCQSGENLHAHHILPRSTHPHLSRDITNGITLCSRCHGSVKGREQEFAEFFTGLLQQTATT